MDWTETRLTDEVVRILNDELLDVDERVEPDSNLVESGVDSLAITQLMLALEQRTGVWVDDSLLTEESIETARTLAALVYGEVVRAHA